MTGVRLRRLDRAGRRALAAALRAGTPVDLDLLGPLPEDLHPAEVGPLVRTARAADPATEVALRRWAAPGGGGRGGPAVTALVPASRGAPLGTAALVGQDLSVQVRILSNGAAGPRRVPGAAVDRVAWHGHGATRQAALADVETPYVLLTVDDALPLGAGFVRALVTALEAGGWDAVVARQVAWPDAGPVVRGRLRAWTPAVDAARPMPHADHVCTLYRTAELRRWADAAPPIAEDLVWTRGRRVGLVPGAPVLHSHARRAAALYARDRAIHAERARLGLPPTAASLAAVAGALGAWRHGPREVARHAAEALGQWAGHRVGRRGLSR